MSISRGLPLNWDQIQSIFTQTYTDPNARSEIMRVYGLTESSSEENLAQGLYTFLNDSMFEGSVDLARTSFRNRRRVTGHPEVKSVHSYFVEFGNPFPGPSQGMSHHCVDLIYLFEAFHDALTLADEGILRPYQEPTSLVRGGKGDSTSTVPDSEVKPRSEKDEGTPETVKETGKKRTHLELCRTLQDHWIDFIVLDDFAPGSSVDEITVFGEDLATRVESIDGPAWKHRRERWDLVAQNLPAMNQTRDMILDFRAS